MLTRLSQAKLGTEELGGNTIVIEKHVYQG
jgi:hypothetical protein